MNEIHLYTNGTDPYTLDLGNTRFVIHQGSPTAVSPIMAAPRQTETDGPRIPDPVDVFIPPELKGPYANYIVGPESKADLDALLEALDGPADIGVVLRDDATPSVAGDQLGVLLEGLRERDAEITVHLVSGRTMSDTDG